MKENLRNGPLIVMKKLVDWVLLLMAVVMVMTKLAIGLDIRVIMNFISNGYLDKEEIILLIALQIELLLLQVIPTVLLGAEVILVQKCLMLRLLMNSGV